MHSKLKPLLSTYQQRLEQALAQRLPPAAEADQRLHEAMRYASLDGGKRVRAVLVYTTGAALGLPPEPLDGAACAVELIHAYSLVHDDLPAMDNDDLRRGKPTCHKAFDEATAILCGDALQTLAFELLASDASLQVDDNQRIRMIGELARASGSRGMAGGQAIDIAAAGTRLDLAALQGMHRYKTGALIRASIRLAAIAGRADEAQQQALDSYAEAIGLAFQIQDDILDVTADTATLGKPQGSDEAQDKPTYTSLLGLDGARQKAAALNEQAQQSLQGFAEEADPLRWLSAYIIERQH